MTELAYDPLEFTRQLEATGCPREQAEVHVRAMTAQYLNMVESLATRDYLDARFTASKSELEAKIEKRFAEVNLRFERAEGKFRLLFWMQAITFAAVVLPSLRDFIL